MSSVIYGTVSPMNPGGGLEDRNETNLQQMFAKSPLPGYDASYDQAAVENICKAVFNGQKPEGGKIPANIVNKLGVDPNGNINEGGYWGGSVNLNYKDAPKLKDVVTGPGGAPGSPYAPNLNSPGPGSVNPADMEYTGTYTKTAQWGSGMNATSLNASPDKTSKGDGISSQLSYAESFTSPRTIGNYISGRSYEGSDGS